MNLPDEYKDFPILSIRQPWAWMITHIGKDIENRTWATNFRGQFLIHAGKKIDKLTLSQLISNEKYTNCPELLTGGIIGIATLVDCVTEHSSRWFEGPYGFVLKDMKVLPFIPLKGQLGFFRIKEIEHAY